MPEATEDFEELKSLRAFVIDCAASPEQPENLFSDLLVALFHPLLFNWNFTKLLRQHDARQLATYLFSDLIPLEQRLLSHPLIRFLTLYPESKERMAMLHDLRFVMTKAHLLSLLYQKHSDIFSALLLLVDTIQEFSSLLNSPDDSIRKKIQELKTSISDLEQDPTDRAVLARLNGTVYDLSEGYDMWHVEQFPKPSIWTHHFGDAMYAPPFRVRLALSEFSKDHPNFGDVWPDILLVLHRRPTRLAGGVPSRNSDFDLIPATIFTYLWRWIGGERATWANLEQLVRSTWFLGFVSRHFSGFNLTPRRGENPQPRSYARVSTTDPAIMSIDFFNGAEVWRYRVHDRTPYHPTPTFCAQTWVTHPSTGTQIDLQETYSDMINFYEYFCHTLDLRPGQRPQSISTDYEWAKAVEGDNPNYFMDPLNAPPPDLARPGNLRSHLVAAGLGQWADQINELDQLRGARLDQLTQMGAPVDLFELGCALDSSYHCPVTDCTFLTISYPDLLDHRRKTHFQT